MTPRTLVHASLIALCLAAPLAGCGKLGELQRPGPLSAEAKRTADPSHTVNTVDPRDRTTDPAPPRTLPLEGLSGSSNAASPPPPSAQPDVYSSRDEPFRA